MPLKLASFATIILSIRALYRIRSYYNFGTTKRRDQPVFSPRLFKFSADPCKRTSQSKKTLKMDVMKFQGQAIVIDDLDIRNRKLHHDRPRSRPPKAQSSSSLRSAFALACLCSGDVVVESGRGGDPAEHSIVRPCC
jgi:hypothetical protein